MNLRVNGEDREVVNDLSLKELVTQLNLTPERIAIELNQNVVRRADWPSTVLRENDQVEIVHFVGGGSAVGRSSRQEDTIHEIRRTDTKSFSAISCDFVDRF